MKYIECCARKQKGTKSDQSYKKWRILLTESRLFISELCYNKIILLVLLFINKQANSLKE